MHRDRRADMEHIQNQFNAIENCGVKFKNFNADALNPEKRVEIIAQIKSMLPPEEKIKILVHSIAKGHLKPMHSTSESELEHLDFMLTIEAMGISLYDWTKALVTANLFSADTRIISYTSEGNSRALPYYGAVSAAKVVLEAITRNIALEFASLGIKANCIQAGITATRSLEMIPGNDKLKAHALKRNPSGRLTTPEDVADATYLLCMEEAKWITGTIIKVDGGESLR